MSADPDSPQHRIKHLTNILMFQINTEPQLESPLSTLAPVRYKHLSKLTVAIAAPGVIVIYVTEVNQLKTIYCERRNFNISTN